MAALLEERGRKDEAIPFLHKALAANPQMTEASALLANLTGPTPSAQRATIASDGPALSSRIAVSAPMATVSPVSTYAASAPMLTSPVMSSPVVNDDITPTPYTPNEAQTAGFSYPSTGAPPMIPMPVQTARVPVGYEPALLPPIR
jgi:hypothetical protein